MSCKDHRFGYILPPVSIAEMAHLPFKDIMAYPYTIHTSSMVVFKCEICLWELFQSIHIGSNFSYGIA
jgi:hypothetical protein